jgi:mannose-1-phosphate guanylyltransferase
VKRITQAAILCGGRGERLKPLTDYYQKTMIPIGPKKLPLLAYIIALLKHHGITKVALLTGYRSQDIKNYFGNGSRHGLKLAYSEDPKDRKGSLNALAHALKNGTISNCDELLIYYGDMLADLEVTALLGVHRKSDADVTLVLDNRYSLPVGVAEVRDGMVASFREKPTLGINVTTGMMVMGPKAMALTRKVASSKRTDLMTDFIPEVLQGGGRVAAFYTTKEWFDVGTLSTFEKLNEELGRHPVSYLV